MVILGLGGWWDDGGMVNQPGAVGFVGNILEPETIEIFRANGWELVCDLLV